MSDIITKSKKELDAMAPKEFQLALDDMSASAIERFSKMRKLPDSLAKVLDTHIAKGKWAAKSHSAKPGRASRSAPTPSKTRLTPDDGYIPFPERFRAWWDGTPIAPVKKPPPTGSRAAKTGTGHQDKNKRDENMPGAAGILHSGTADPDPDWTARVRTRVWGEGFGLPGGPDVICAMARLCDTQIGDKAAIFSAGASGPAVALAAETLASVTCFEPEGSTWLQAGVPQRDAITLNIFDEHTPDFGSKVFRRFFARENMCFAPSRQKVLKAASHALQGGGQFVFNDFVLLEHGHEMDAVKSWRATEPMPPLVWTIDDYKRHLSDARLELKGTANLTKSYVAQVEADWRRLMESLVADPLPPEGVDALMSEGTIWQARIAALKTGQLSIVRFHTALRTIRSLSGPA